MYANMESLISGKSLLGYHGKFFKTASNIIADINSICPNHQILIHKQIRIKLFLVTMDDVRGSVVYFSGTQIGPKFRRSRFIHSFHLIDSLFWTS